MQFALSCKGGDAFSSEPLFLIKWKALTYAQVTWEPLSELSPENQRRVHDFLVEKHSCGMKRRLMNSRATKTHQQMLDVEQSFIAEGPSVPYSRVFLKQKQILDDHSQTHNKIKLLN